MITQLLRQRRASCRFAFILLISTFVATPQPAVAEQVLPDSRTLFPDDWSGNLRFAVDLSSRQLYSTGTDDWHQVYFLGTDLHKVFTGESGDVGTLTLQGYFTHIEDEAIRPGFFDGDTTYVFRIFNYNHALLPRGRMNLKIGHFEIPMGLEHSINTNGTLRDYTHGRNIGVKADWGVSLNGILSNAEYEVSVTRGSGNDWITSGDPYIAAGRIATPGHRNPVLGVSAMSGDVYVPNSNGLTVERQRVGVDMQWYINQYGLFGEVSVGENDGEQTSTSLIELNRAANNGAWMAYTQFIYSTRNPAGASQLDASTVLLGAKWNLQRWDLSLQVSHDLNSFDNTSEKNVYVAQARFRF